jgi:hypothetical protein
VMTKYSSEKHALGISDRSGAAYKLRNMRKEWNGFLVGYDEWESKQPQLTPPRISAESQALRNPRPDRVEPAVMVLLSMNPFRTGSSGSAVITVAQPGHERSTGDTVRFRKVEAFDGFTESAIEDASGFSITKVDADTYTFTAGSGTSTTGNVDGGGGSASAGPVTVSA